MEIEDPMTSGERSALRATIRSVVTLAVPVAVLQVGMMTMGVVDTIMLGRVSPEAMAASAIVNTFVMAVLLMMMGVLFALNPIVAQAHGAGRLHMVGEELQRGWFLALFLVVPPLAILWWMGPLQTLLHQPVGIYADAVGYAHWLMPGMPAMLLAVATRQVIQGLGVVRPLLLAMLIANIVNVFANAVLIFGLFGAPELGVLGCAISTSIARWCTFIGMVVFGWPVLAPTWQGWTRAALRIDAFKQLLHLGLPIGVQMFVEVGIFVGVTALMGVLGVIELAGHQVALNLASLTFMVPLGLAIAGTTRVGFAVGSNNPGEARRVAMVSMALGVTFMLCTAVAFTGAPLFFAHIYTSEPEVQMMALVLIPIAGVFQVFDGMQVVASGLLRGLGDTKAPALIALVGFWLVGAPVGLALCWPQGWGAAGLWWGLTVGLGVVALLLCIRLWVRFSGEFKAIVSPNHHDALAGVATVPPNSGTSPLEDTGS